MNNTSTLTITAKEFIQTDMLFEKKTMETSERGLASFPKNSATDEALIQRTSKRRRHFGEDVIMELPNVPIKVKLNNILPDDLVYYLAIGDYERSDLDLIEKAVKLGDTVLDIGGGIGICASRMAQCAKNKITIVEARKDLQPYIQETLKINHIEGHIIQAALTDDLPDNSETSFSVSENLWYSSLSPHGEEKVITVPTRTLESLYDEFLPDSVLMDVEGAEATLNFNTKHKPRELIVEIHTPSIGSEKTCEVIQRIVDAGYCLKDVSSQTWWFSLRKQ